MLEEGVQEEIVTGNSSVAHSDPQILGSTPVFAGMRADALHIALAAVARADVLVSWHFKHIVNLKRIHAYNAVNLKQGYPVLEIRTPREVPGDE